MFSTVAKSTKLRKEKMCDWCAEIIAAGEQCMSWFCAEGGFACTIRMHPECYEAAVSTYMSSDEELPPAGDNPRGCACNFSRGCECGWEKLRKDITEE